MTGLRVAGRATATGISEAVGHTTTTAVTATRSGDIGIGIDTPAKRDKGNDKGKEKAPVRDAWMTDPAAFEVEHVRRPECRPSKSPPPEPPTRTIHSRELNTAHLEDLNRGTAPAASAEAPSRTVDYVFGDAGSAWRMTKLRAVYDTAEESGRPVEEVALQRFGSLEFFDDAREEREEMERRRLYGEGYRGKDRPTGELYRERTKEHFRERSPSAEPSPEQSRVHHQQQQQPVAAPMDQTALNRLRAQMMKAKLRRAPDAAKLEEEYNRAAAAAAAAAGGAGVGSSAISAPEAVVLGAMESRLLAGPRGEITSVDTKRGRERGLVQENAEMTLDDMVREERRTKGEAGGEGMRLAERIAKDARFGADLEYMDENAERLARRVHKSEVSLKNVAVHEFQRLDRILEACPLCHKDDRGLPPLAPVVALATRVFLTLTTDPEISPGGAVIAPLAHRRNLLECDDDEWEELRNFMKSLTRMYHDQGREVLFYENAAAPQRHLHAAMVAVPIPYDQGAMAPAFFREAFLSSDEEWSQHRKVIDTAAKARDGMGRMAFRRSIAKESPYFHVWFGLDGGLGHIVENADKWPRGDLFAREVIGGIVDAEPHIIKKQGRWSKTDGRVDGFKKGWRKFDWTRVLTEG
ncbi:Pre-mRNA-splicing factor cwf19 [Escovopsis weberi]|uniref:Pre-mRNA-splicing factor cwf19 n=1 Tax=Escovopsis weberi TaxID=150374 RepID=A0A0M9VWC4_ESCWE|nr:Pre-mRNA-splicing factor cwf19 [Escovopsis weberi]